MSRTLSGSLIKALLGFFLCATANATNYYISSSTGSDANNGLTPATAWQTAWQVNKVTHAASDSIFLRAGDTWDYQTLTIGWSGTATNHAVIGAYYVNSSGATVRGIGSNARPIFNNHYKGLQPITASHPSNPSQSEWVTAIQVTGSYVDVENIEIDQYGVGMYLGGGNTLLVNNIKTNGTYFCGIHAESVSNITIENSEVYQHNALASPQFKDYGQNWCCGISLYPVAGALVKNSYIHEGWGEGLIAENGSTNITVVHNTFFANAKLGVYFDSTAGGEIAYNMILGSSDPQYWRGTTAAGPGIGLSNEGWEYAGSGASNSSNLCPYGPYSPKYSGIEINGNKLCPSVTQNIKIHDNLVAGTNNGLALWSAYPQGTTYSGSVPFANIQVYNNTFIDNNSQLLYEQTYNSSFENNIFLSLSNKVDAKGVSQGPTADAAGVNNDGALFSNNYWSQGTPDSTFASGKDVYSGIKLAQMSVGFYRSIKSPLSVTSANFAPLSGSTTNSRGTALMPAPFNVDFYGKSHRDPMDLGAIGYGSSGSTSSPTPSAPVAAFSCTPLSGTAPLAVTCTDASTNTPTSWTWTFGDGSASTAKNQSHTYQTAGTYTVALTAANAAGAQTVTKTSYVTVSAPASAPLTSGSSISPNPAHPGQTITVKTNLNPGLTASGTMVVIWYNSSTPTLIGRSAVLGVDFVAGKATPLTATFVVPAGTATGTYSLSATIYKDSTSGTVLKGVPAFINFTVN